MTPVTKIGNEEGIDAGAVPFGIEGNRCHSLKKQRE
jgi:hypothetical protein